MPFDGLLMKKIVNEIKEKITGPLRNVYQASKVDYYLVFQDGSVRISLNPSFSFIAKMEKLNLPSKMPPSFTMLLRKHLKNARFLGIEQEGFSRIAYFRFRKLDEMGDEREYLLVAEIMGKFSNLILVDDRGKIVDVHRRIVTSQGRELLPTKDFRPYESKKMDPENFEISKMETKGKKCWKAIVENIEGFSKIAASEVCFRAGLSSQDPLEQKDFQNLKRALEELMNEWKVTDAFVLKEGDAVVDVSAVRLTHLPLYHQEMLPSEAIKTFVNFKEEKDILENKRSDLEKTVSKEIKKLEDTLEKVREDIEKARGFEKFRKWGELLKAYHYLIKEGKRQVLLTDWESGKQIEVPILEGRNALESSKIYFEKYKKLKRKYEAATKRAYELQKQLFYLEQLLQTLEDADTLEDLEEITQEMEQTQLIKKKKKGTKKAQKVSEPRKFVRDGFVILVGKNNRQNDELVRNASPNDIWLHAHEIPGAHVIIKTGGRKVKEETLEYAASLAAGYSRGKDSGRVAVDYTLAKFVKKPKGFKPGMVIYRNYKTLFVKPRRS